MTDLTEKYKKGKLDLDHSYYLKMKNGRIEIQLYVGGFIMEEDNEVVEVLTEVPSYDELCFKNSELVAANSLLRYEKERNAELKAIIKKREIKIKELYETIDKFADSNLDLIKNIETLAQKLLQVKPELREWLEVNFKEYL